MRDFYMLAGTVLCDLNLTELQALLAEHSIKSEIDEDELLVSGIATFGFRRGFEHEYILVGDAGDGEILLAEARNISSLLCQHNILHGFEIYDTDNLRIFDYQFEG